MQKAEENVTLTRSEYDRLVSIEQQLEELKRLVYGSRSERFIADNHRDQLSLFEASKQLKELEKEAQIISYQRKEKAKEKKQPSRALLPAHLPREEEVIEPEDLNEGMRKIGEEVTEILEHTPAKLYVRRIVRPKYIQLKSDIIHVGELPSLPIPKGNAGASLLAYILVCKFIDHLPFYRQRQIFKREGVVLAESTINGWFKSSCELLVPLYECLAKQIKEQDYLQADESPIAVQSSQKPGATHTGYHWVYHSPLKKMALFDYQKSRSRQGPEEFLKSFTGYLQTDGYAGYNQIGKREDITLLACMAHARRYFEKALDNDKQAAEHALTVIQSLYAIERDLKEIKADSAKIEKVRKETALPILNNWKKWLQEQQMTQSAKSPIGKAVNYTLGLWSRLIRYIEKSDLIIDNNKIENLIRPLALGRKNYLFAGSHNAAQHAAMMYSFFATCKLNDINPYTWLKEVLDKISDTKVTEVDQLLPQNWINNQ